MKITCPACDAEYNVDPSRIPAAGLNMRCPQCSKSFRVTADGSTAVEGSADTLLDGGGQSLGSERLYVRRPTGKVFGPFDRNAIQMMLKTEKLSGDAEVSPDKQTWQSVLEIPAFSQFVKDKPLPSLDVEDPKATMMSGWQSSGSKPDLSAPKLDLPVARAAPELPAAKGGGPPDLPAPKSGRPDLPIPKSGSPPDLPAARGSDLPAARGGPGLPTPRSAIDLPLPKSGSEGLPVPRADLPASKSDADLPTQVHQELPVPRAPSFEEDLFGDGGGGSASGADDDLFGAPAAGGSSDDLFGPAGGDDDDLFGPPADRSPAPAVDDDIFSAPIPDKVDDDDDLFAETGGDDLFANEESDIFGSPAGDDDLFGSAGPAPSARGDDFLDGDGGFSFLDDQPAAAPADEWGDDLFGESHAEVSTPAAAASQGGLDSWGEDLLDEPPRQARAPRSADSQFDADDPFRPASAGIRESEADVSEALPEKAATVADDRKRGGAVQILVVLVAILVVGGGGFIIVNMMSSPTETPTDQPVKKRIDIVTVDMIKSDNFADYAILSDTASKPQKGEEGLWLLAHSIMLARFDDADAVKRAAPVAQTLDGAKEGFDAVGRGAWEARSGNADAARAYLEGLSGESGDVGFFANLAMGLGDTKAVEAELARAAAIPIEQVPPQQQLPPGVPDDGGSTNGAAADEGSTNGATNSAVIEPEKPRTSNPTQLGGLDQRARAALAAAAKLDERSHLPHFWKGRLERHLKRTDEATDALVRALKFGPKHVGTHVELGAAYYEAGELNKSIELLEKVTGELSSFASASEKATALHHAGLVHVARRDSDLAIEAFTKALNIDANRGNTLRALAEEYERAQKYKEALTFFTTNQKLAKNDPNVMLGIVRSHIGLEQWQNAIATLEEGQKSFPDDAQFPYYLGQLFMKRGAFADAQKPLERAVDIDPSLLRAHATLAQLAWRTDKDMERGEAHIAEIVARPAAIDADVATAVAEYYDLSGRRDTAEQWYREALKRDRNNWPARLALARLLLEEGEQEQARTLLEQARKEGVQDVRLSAYLADAYRQAQDYDRAIDEINQVIEAFPKSEDYIFIRGRIHFDRGNYDNAQDDFQKAYDLNPRYHDAYFYVGRTAFERKDYQNALKIFRHVLDYKPDRGNYRFFMGRTLEAEGRTAQALEEYRKSTAVDPAFGVENPMVYVYRGRLLSRLGYSKEGKGDIARALELAPTNVEALLAMADSEYRDHNYAEAILHYRAALDVDPIQPQPQARLGMALLFSDRRQEAAQRLQLAIKYGHDDPETFKRLGYLYKEMGQRAQARDAFTRFLEKAQEKGNVPTATKREILDQLEQLK